MSYRSVVVTVAILLCLALAKIASAAQLAQVVIHEPGEWRTLQIGTTTRSYLTTTGPTEWWNDLGVFIGNQQLEFYWLDKDPAKSAADDYGLVDFTVMTMGKTWMIVSSRFGGGGNSSGDWIPELTSEAELLADGWTLLASDIYIEAGYMPFGQNLVGTLTENPFLLYERSSLPGDTFSMRTEKYVPPVLLRAVPEPTTVALMVLGTFAIIRRRSN